MGPRRLLLLSRRVVVEGKQWWGLFVETLAAIGVPWYWFLPSTMLLHHHYQIVQMDWRLPEQQERRHQSEQRDCVAARLPGL